MAVVMSASGDASAYELLNQHDGGDEVCVCVFLCVCVLKRLVLVFR